MNEIIYWVRSIGLDGVDRVPMYYKGLCDNPDEGIPGFDIKARPVSLGEGEYTATYGGADFELANGDKYVPVV